MHHQVKITIVMLLGAWNQCLIYWKKKKKNRHLHRERSARHQSALLTAQENRPKTCILNLRLTQGQQENKRNLLTSQAIFLLRTLERNCQWKLHGIELYIVNGLRVSVSKMAGQQNSQQEKPIYWSLFLLSLIPAFWQGMRPVLGMQPEVISHMMKTRRNVRAYNSFFLWI